MNELPEEFSAVAWLTEHFNGFMKGRGWKQPISIKVSRPVFIKLSQELSNISSDGSVRLLRGVTIQLDDTLKLYDWVIDYE